MCLHGDLLGAQVDVLVWQIGAGAGICVYTMVWHTCGYLRCYNDLARVRGHIHHTMMIATPLAATFPGSTSSSMLAVGCRSTYVSQANDLVQQCGKTYWLPTQNTTQSKLLLLILTHS